VEEPGAQYEQLKSQLERLENENQRLSGQVKRLLRTEHELSHAQGQLDTQIRLYRQLYEVGKKFNATFDLAEILHAATEFILYELNFERCLVLLRSEETKDLHVQALDGYYDESIRHSMTSLSLSMEESALLPLRSGAGQVMCTAECDQEQLRALGCTFGMAEYAIFPLGGEPQNPIGLLVAGNTADNLEYHTRIQSDSEFMVGLANLVSLATTTINNVNFYASLARLHEERTTILREQLARVTAAQEEERQRIARELHDGVGPALASLNIRLRTARKLLDQDHPAAEEIEELAELAQTNIQDIRRLVYDLRPAILDELGLVPALKEYVARYEKDQKLEVILSLPAGDERLPAPLETALFRVIQEALANAARHARAQRVEIALRWDNNQVSACISDDGQGFDLEEAQTQARQGGHLGLWSMRERMEQLGGQFEVHSASGQGTTIKIKVPIQVETKAWTKSTS
jgi:signal transduction histidine kinase